METLERRTMVSPGYDLRNDPRGDYGISGAQLSFAVIGKAGAISVTFSTDWYPKAYQEAHAGTPSRWVKPDGRDLAYHSRRPTEYAFHNESCLWLDGHECWSDGSGLLADAMRDVLLTEGDEGVWRELESRYADQWGREE